MEISYSVIDGKSRGFKVLVAVLGVILAVFVVGYLVAYLSGFQVWGISNAIPWGQLITFDIYFIGLSAGAIVVSSLGYVFNRKEFKPIGRIAVYMGLLLMIGAMVCVLADLGRPEKFWRLFGFFLSNNMTSLFAVNGIFYGGYILLMIVYLWLVMEGKMKAAALIGIIDVLWAVMVHTGTGAIFGLISTREIMASPLKPFEFIAAALTSGTALLIVVSFVAFKYARRALDSQLLVSLGRMLSYIVIVLLLMIFFDKLSHAYMPHREGTLFLFTGPYWWIFWVFQIGMGIVVPLVVLFNPRTKNSVPWILGASVSVVIGVLGERAALVLPSTAFPQALFPGHIEGIWGAVTIFPITFWETTISIGVLALVTLLFVLGLRYLELLPAAPAKAKKSPPADVTSEEAPEKEDESAASDKNTE